MKIRANVFGSDLIVEHPNAKECLLIFNNKLKKELLRDDRVLVRNIKSNGVFDIKNNSWVLSYKNHRHCSFLKWCFMLACDHSNQIEDKSINVGMYNISFLSSIGLVMKIKKI